MSGVTLRTTHDRPCPVVNGYSMVFHKHNRSLTAFYWRCSKYNRCPARGRSDTEDGPVTMTSGAETDTFHNHLADPLSPEKRRRTMVVKEAAKANRATPSMTIASDAQEGLEPDQLQAFPTQRALQQTINNARRIAGAKEADKEPHVLALPPELQRTLRGERFLIADTRETDPEKPAILAFSSPFGARLLHEHKHWALDGTFFSAPKYFKQLVTINVIIGKSSLPAAYILLMDKKQSSYGRALDAIFEHAEMQGVQCESFITDFEIGLANAMFHRFPLAQLRFCHFHLSKSVFTNLQKCGLLPLYENGSDTKALLRCFASLAYLPPNEVRAGFNDICSCLDELLNDETIPEGFRSKIAEFVRYFRDTYIGRIVDGRTVRPRFEINAWNCFSRMLEGSPRTNNSVEGWHAYLNALFPKAHMVLSQFIIRMQKEEERTHNMSVQHDLNPAEHLRGRRKESTKREENLLQLVKQYSAIPVENRSAQRLLHLLKVQYHLSPKAFERVENAGSCASDRENTTPTSSQGDPSEPTIPMTASSEPSTPLQQRLQLRSLPATPLQRSTHASPGQDPSATPLQRSTHASPSQAPSTSSSNRRLAFAESQMSLPSTSQTSSSLNKASSFDPPAAKSRRLQPFSFFD